VTDIQGVFEKQLLGRTITAVDVVVEYTYTGTNYSVHLTFDNGSSMTTKMYDVPAKDTNHE